MTSPSRGRVILRIRFRMFGLYQPLPHVTEDSLHRIGVLASQQQPGTDLERKIVRQVGYLEGASVRLTEPFEREFLPLA
jgi:hypothetical protein